MYLFKYFKNKFGNSSLMTLYVYDKLVRLDCTVVEKGNISKIYQMLFAI